MRTVMILVFFLIGCSTDIPTKTNHAGRPKENINVPNEQFKVLAVHCLRDFLIGEDAGGTWKLIDKPPGSILLQDNLDGTDNPCLDFAEYGCGLYRVQYKINDPCCQDSVAFNINKRCCNVQASISCN